MVSCSPQKKHDTLSIFFDGVPDPKIGKTKSDSASLAVNISSETRKKAKSEKKFEHPPHENGSCSDCHNLNESFHLVESQPVLCQQCHDDFAKKYKLVHGPAASGFCTQCHDPHSSKYAKLLTRDGNNLCYFCHDKALVYKNDIHTSIGDSKCWDCHNPHGGADRTFMK